MTHQTKSMQPATQQRFDFSSGNLVAPVKTEISAHRIHSRNKLDKYLRGTRICKAVAYVISLDKIADYIEKVGFDEFHVIIGKEVSASKHRSLNPDLIEKLVRWESEGRLHIRVPKKERCMRNFSFAGTGRKVVQRHQRFCKPYVDWYDQANQTG